MLCKTCGKEISKEICNRFCTTTCMLQAPKSEWKGARFGRLTIVSFLRMDGQKRVFLAENYNGKTKEVSGSQLMDSKYKISAGFKEVQREHYSTNSKRYKKRSDRNRRTIDNRYYKGITLPIKYRYYVNEDKKKGFDPPDYPFEELLIRIATNRCFYCGSTDNLGLDRIDNSKGHTKDNTVVCCYRCNMTRSDNFTHEEFKTIGKAIRKVDELRSAQTK